MCGVVPRHLGKGDAALSRCIPQALAQNRHRASLHHRNVRRFIALRVVRSCPSPRPHPGHRHRRWTCDRERMPPWTLHQCRPRMEAAKGAFGAPLDPIEQKEISPLPLHTHRLSPLWKWLGILRPIREFGCSLAVVKDAARRSRGGLRPSLTTAHRSALLSVGSGRRNDLLRPAGIEQRNGLGRTNGCG